MSPQRLNAVMVCVILFLHGGSAQESISLIIGGKVEDASTGNAVPFANVFVAGSTIGTSTDENGYFRFTVKGLTSFDIVFLMSPTKPGGSRCEK